MNDIIKCSSCSADWSANSFSEECAECGGGAMERNCFVCNGRCNSVYKRAVLDSWDTGEAHWVGCCKLPPEEKIKYMV